MYAPFADQKPRPVRVDARTCHPFYQHTVQHQEENATAEEDIGTRRQASGSCSLAIASSDAGRHW